MSSLTIYGIPASRAFRTIWMAEELALDYQNIPLNPTLGETRTSEFLDINPNGHTPALRDGDFVIWESLAINLYLAKRYPGPLSPAGLSGEARALQWSMWAMTELETPTGNILRGMTSPDAPAGSADDPVADDAALKAALAVLEDALAADGWLLEARFTVADLNIASVLSPLPRIRYRFEPFPAVKNWLKTRLFRPAAVAAYKLGVASMKA